MLTRIIYVTLFSIYFYYKSSGLFFFLLLFVATSDFCIAQCMTKTASKWGRKAWVVLSLCVDLGLLGYFKYFNFLREIMAAVAHELGYQLGNTSLQNITYQPLDIFLPVGISFFTFQTISYVIDVYRGRIAPLRRWIDYVFYVSFFPQLVAGPIVRARDFIPQIYKTPVVTRAEFGEGLFLVLCGLFKKTVISDYISLNFVDRIFDAGQGLRIAGVAGNPDHKELPKSCVENEFRRNSAVGAAEHDRKGALATRQRPAHPFAERLGDGLVGGEASVALLEGAQRLVRRALSDQRSRSGEGQ